VRDFLALLDELLLKFEDLEGEGRLCATFEIPRALYHMEGLLRVRIYGQLSVFAWHEFYGGL